MRIVITCGPSYEPVDEVRRLTNFSTGELGVLLANRLTADGHEVFCLKGEAATYAGACRAHHLISFSTNDNLLANLQAISKQGEIGAVLHCAALCDFKVKQVQNATGEKLTERKVSSRAGDLTIVLEPASKVISHLRRLFPEARIIGWKYELDGTREDALAKGRKQIEENATDLSVVNGRAFGKGFEVVDVKTSVASLACKDAIVDWLSVSLK
ncbi:MAG TPA: phosphopantothenoylcysteine decarboxylase [Verrucomicrobiae bacterium]